ncbi:S8/S53 family peptidase, partial [Asanoa sp. NPDC050611]|uniref:S8 family peptidase n=1 Tax=Asanoa sp. NPDC050611 TaxID=3157098 RepID=UPI0033F53575
MTRNPGGVTWPEPVDRALDAFTPSTADTRAIVGVIDTGVVVIDGPHERISPCLDRLSLFEENQDQLPPDGDLALADGHGTFVIGRILREAGDVVVMSRRAVDTEKNGDDKLVARHLTYFAGLDPVQRPQVVNLSFYGVESAAPTEIGDALLTLLDAAPDVVVVTSAGNRWTDEPPWPAAFHRDLKRHGERVVAVGAVDTSILRPLGESTPPRASFSNTWPRIQLWAPGVRVLGPHVRYVDNRYQFCSAVWSGTSFAAATVTGRLAAGVRDGWTAPDVLAGLVSEGAPPGPSRSPPRRPRRRR